MAKKQQKPAQEPAAEGRDRQVRAESVRAAAAQAVAAAAGQAQVTRDRAQDLADELAGAAQKVRDAFEDLRPPTGEDIRTLRRRLDALERRVADLEAQAAKPKRAAKPARASKKDR